MTFFSDIDYFHLPEKWLINKLLTHQDPGELWSLFSHVVSARSLHRACWVTKFVRPVLSYGRIYFIDQDKILDSNVETKINKKY